MNPCPRTVLVTGCSSGIGRVIAALLAEKGFQVFAGVRRECQAEELASLKLPHLTPVVLDVLNQHHITGVVQMIGEATSGQLYGLVNNAGMGLATATELTSCDELRQLLEVNTIAPLAIIQQCLPLLRACKGRIVNISSMNGTMALPMVGAYSASKFALEAISDTLRVELRPWGVTVSLIRPGQIRTPIFAKARTQIADSQQQIPDALRRGYDEFYRRANYFNERGAKSRTPPDAVARAALKALQARWPLTHYHVGWDAFGMRLAKNLPSRLVDRALARVMGLMDLK